MIFRKSAYVVALMGALAGSVASEQVEDDIALLKLDDKVYWNRFLQNSASPTRAPTPGGPGPSPPTRAPTPQPPAELPSQSPSMEPTGSAPTPVGTLSFDVDFECRVRFEESETNDDPAQDDRLCADWNLNGRDMTKQTFQFKGGACPATATASTAQDYECLNQRTVATTGDNTVTMVFLYGDWFSQLNSNTLTYTGLSNAMLGFLPDGSTLNDANNYVAFLKTGVKLDTFFSLDDLDSPPTGLAVDTNYLTMFIFDGTDDNTIYQVNKWFYPGTFGTPPNSYRIFQRFGATELVSMEDDRFGFVGYSTTNNNQIRGQVDYKYDIKSNPALPQVTLRPSSVSSSSSPADREASLPPKDRPRGIPSIASGITASRTAARQADPTSRSSEAALLNSPTSSGTSSPSEPTSTRYCSSTRLSISAQKSPQGRA